MPDPAGASVDQHFARRSAVVRAVYDRLVAATRSFGPVVEDPKKTSIHLVRRTAFAGVACRSASIVLTIKSATDIHSPRVLKREQVSPGRWHVEVRLDDPAQVDFELTAWLRSAYDLSR
jgi:hypothetical protein